MNTKIEKLNANKELQKNISKMNHYNSEQFLKDAQQYIKAIKERRMLCCINSVSKSGMSRTLSFKSCEKSKYAKNDYWYSNYYALFTALGHTRAGDYFRVNGCGMDMVFATNYNNIHEFKNLGIISKKECDKLCQMTPTCI